MLRSLLFNVCEKKGFAGDFGLHSLASPCISALPEAKREVSAPIFGSARDVSFSCTLTCNLQV